MEALENILRQHAKRYPMMQPTDAVKLICQNKFGGGQQYFIRSATERKGTLRSKGAVSKLSFVGTPLLRFSPARRITEKSAQNVPIFLFQTPLRGVPTIENGLSSQFTVGLN